MTNTLTPIRTADLGDVLAAGMDYPTRDAMTPLSFESATALFRARREFWLAAAAGYLDLAEAGCPESLGDAREALAQADRYAPRAA